MAITIELTPEVEARLRKRAQARGLDVPTYASELLKQATGSLSDSNQGSLAEFEAALDQLAAHSQKIPLLPDEAFTRANLYSDHD